MRLANRFKSLTWKSLVNRSARRLRGQSKFSPISLAAAEILEQRRMLSNTVTMSTLGTAITMTSHTVSGERSGINLYRLDSGHVEIDTYDGTTITNNGGTSLVL